MQKNILLKLLVVLGLLFPNTLFAETINLKSGKKIEGKILEKTDQYIKIELNGSPVYYELKYVASINEDSPASPAQEEPSFKDINLYFKNGLGYASEAKFKEAEEEFKKGLAIKPSDHNLNEVLKILNDLKSGLIKEEYALYLFKGSHYLINRQYQQAITEFKEALRLKQDDPDLYCYLGVCNYYLEQYQEAVNNFKKAMEKKSYDDLYYYLGVCSYSLGKYSEAITYLQKLLEISPDDAEAYSVIGTCYYFLGQFPQAKENLSKAKELFQGRGNYLEAKDIEVFLSGLN